MLLKALYFLTTTLFVFSQLVLGDERAGTLNHARDPQVYCSKFVYISGREYCIFTETLYQDEAQLVCQNTNGMNLITFDDRDNKYFEVLDWLPNNGYSGYFWTSGFRGEGESIWTWRSTNKTITSFKWAWHSPSLDEDLTSKVCIGFLATDNTVDAGWADFRCNQEFPLNTICEHYP